MARRLRLGWAVMLAQSRLPLVFAAMALALAVACASPAGPDLPTSPPPSPSAPAAALTGRVVDQFGGAPLAGIAVRYAGASAITDADGRFSISGTAAGAGSLLLAGAGIHSRETLVGRVAGEELKLEVVPDVFDMSAFHDVGREHGERTIRWLASPSIYVDKRLTGGAVDPAELERWIAEVERLAPFLVAEWAGGAFGVPSVTVGEAPPSSGAIVVRFDEDPNGYSNERVAGMTQVTWSIDGVIGSARIRLRLSNLEGPAGGYARQAVLAHEIGHAMGLSHMDGATSSILTPVIRTPLLTEFDRAAGRILYSRPPGNTSLDRDTRSPGASLAPAGSASAAAEWDCGATVSLDS